MTVLLFVNLAAFLISWALNFCYSGSLFIDFVDIFLHEPVLAPTLAVLSAIHLKRFKFKWLVVLLMILNLAVALFSAYLIWEVFYYDRLSAFVDFRPVFSVSHLGSVLLALLKMNRADCSFIEIQL